tara:strand:+ start:182 stop:679 length:498 start_codon:yes stop_codon:yes gene_type:complete
MAELNFPNSPNDGDTYDGPNGAVYKYSAAADTWTGTLVTTSRIDPLPSDVTASPDFVSGSGTISDPYIITPATANLGQLLASTQVIQVTGQSSNKYVVFVNNSDQLIASKFEQLRQQTDNNGNWEGHITYDDSVGLTTREPGTYVGKLQLGFTYFQWTITQTMNT